MASSEHSLPSPDRVANLWRYGETPPKLKSVSEDGDVNVEEGDQMESESFGGEREFSNSLDVNASQREEHENLSQSGRLEDISAGEMSALQVEQHEQRGDVFSSRRQVEDVSEGDSLPQFQDNNPHRETEKGVVAQSESISVSGQESVEQQRGNLFRGEDASR